MKKISFFFALITLLLTARVVSGQTNEEFRPGGKIFGLLFTDFHTTFSDGAGTSAFEVRRSYLGFDYSFSPTFSSRILYDGTTDTINGKMIYTGYLRNAYIQYDNGNLIIRGGLIGAEHISVTEKLWNYRYVTKPFIDYTGMVFTADLGLMAKARAGDRLILDLSVTNGRGFRDIAPDGTYRFSAGASVMPLKNLIIRGYYDIMGPSGRMQRTASIIGAWTGRSFSAGAEYLRQDNHLMTAGKNYTGFSLFASLNLSEKVSLFARFDDISSTVPEDSDEAWNLPNDGGKFFIGLDISPVHNVRFSPNFTGFIPDDENAAFAGTVGLNVEARF
jgi:hypothetical protein